MWLMLGAGTSGAGLPPKLSAFQCAMVASGISLHQLNCGEANEAAKEVDARSMSYGPKEGQRERLQPSKHRDKTHNAVTAGCT